MNRTSLIDSLFSVVYICCYAYLACMTNTIHVLILNHMTHTVRVLFMINENHYCIYARPRPSGREGTTWSIPCIQNFWLMITLQPHYKYITQHRYASPTAIDYSKV